MQELHMRNRIAAFALAGVFGLVPFAAGAQWVAPPDDVPPPGAAVSAADARDIAANQGVEYVNRLHFDRDDGRWYVHGRDYKDNWVDMEIDANTGVIVDLDR
jgi:hypothetical protein